jgi:hypothetical protein
LLCSYFQRQFGGHLCSLLGLSALLASGRLISRFWNLLLKILAHNIWGYSEDMLRPSYFCNLCNHETHLKAYKRFSKWSPTVVLSRDFPNTWFVESILSLGEHLLPSVALGSLLGGHSKLLLVLSFFLSSLSWVAKLLPGFRTVMFNTSFFLFYKNPSFCPLTNTFLLAKSLSCVTSMSTGSPSLTKQKF